MGWLSIRRFPNSIGGNSARQSVGSTQLRLEGAPISHNTTLTYHDDSEDQVADFLQQLRPKGQEQSGHHFNPAHYFQKQARLWFVAKFFQGKDIGKAYKLGFLGQKEKEVLEIGETLEVAGQEEGWPNEQ